MNSYVGKQRDLETLVAIHLLTNKGSNFVEVCTNAHCQY